MMNSESTNQNNDDDEFQLLHIDENTTLKISPKKKPIDDKIY